MKDSIKVFSPASIGNIGCGFDVLGLCLDNLGDEIELIKSDTNRIKIIEITGDNNLLPKDPKSNSVSIAINSFLYDENIQIGIDIFLRKKMPIKSGLGSSAASAVGGIYGISRLLNLKRKKSELIKYAMHAEKKTSGSDFPDNVSASMLGGIILARKKTPLDIIEISYPKDLYIVLIYQNIHLDTKKSRSILPRNISLSLATKQWGNIGGLVLGFERGDYDLIYRSIEDFVAEPTRSKLIPNFISIKKRLQHCPKNAFGISGSGPTCFALCQGQNNAMIIKNELSDLSKKNNFDLAISLSQVNNKGVKIIK